MVSIPAIILACCRGPDLGSPHAGRIQAKYVRFVHPQPQPGQAAEYARRWKAILAPRAQAIPGFRVAYFVGDPPANTVHVIFVFDDKPSEALDQAMDDFRQRCRDITSGPALREDFVVLAEAYRDVHPSGPQIRSQCLRNTQPFMKPVHGTRFKDPRVATPAAGHRDRLSKCAGGFGYGPSP